MTHFKHLSTAILFAASIAFLGQVTSAQEISLFLDAANRFVLASDGHDTIGFDIKSPSGSLVPVDDGAGTPFTFLLAKTPSQITWGNLASRVNVDGIVNLKAGWNPAGQQDVNYSYSDGDDAVGPFVMPIGNYTECTDCPPPPPQFGLNDNNQFEVNAFGQELRGLEIWSRSNSLLPGASPAPFTAIGESNAGLVRYDAGDGVTIDGTVALSTTWNPRVGGRDVSFRYAVPSDTPPGPSVEPGRLTGSVNSDGFLVITGNNVSAAGLDLISSTNSLIPLAPGDLTASAEPFTFLLSNNTGQVTYGNLGTSVVIDGDLTLGVGFSGVDPATELTGAWGGGGTPVSFPFLATIPDVIPDPDGGGPPAGQFTRWKGPVPLDAAEYPPQVFYPRINVTLDDVNKLVLNGSGHPIREFGLISNSGSLVPSDELGPFAAVTSNTSRQVTYLAEEQGEVVLDGALTLGTAWNPEGSKDVRFNYELVGEPQTQFGSVASNAYPLVPICSGGRSSAGVGVYINKQNRFVLHADGHELTSVSLDSESGGLIPGDTAFPFEAFESQTAELVTMSNAGAAPITLDGSVTLSTSWNEAVGTQDVHVDFDAIGLPDSIYPGCINPGDPDFPGNGGGGGDNGGQRLVASYPLEGGPITVFAVGGPISVAGLDFVSPNSGLVPIGSGDTSASAEPFSFLLANTEQQVTYGNLGVTVTIDGALTLSVGAKPNARITASWGNGASPVAFPVTQGGPVVPEPASGLLLLFVGLVLPVARKSRCRRIHVA